MQTVLQGKMSTRVVAGGSSSFPFSQEKQQPAAEDGPRQKRGENGWSHASAGGEGAEWLTGVPVSTRLHCSDRTQARAVPTAVGGRV